MPLEINKMTRGRNKACCTIGIGSSILARTFFGVRTRGCIVNLSEKLSVSMWKSCNTCGKRATYVSHEPEQQSNLLVFRPWKNKTHRKDDNTKPTPNNTIFSLAAKPITSSTCLLPFAKPMKSSARLLPFAKPITSSKCSLLFAEPITSSANFSSVAG